MGQEMDWRKEIYHRAMQEYEAFVQGLKQLPFEQVLAHAHEVAIKLDIVQMLGDGAEMDLQGLREMGTPLSAIYKEWKDDERGYRSHLQRNIQRCANKASTVQAEEYYKNPEAPLYRKNLIEAQISGEIHLWRGDKKRNEECLAYFDKNIHERYEKREFPAFLQLWVDEFGLERCKTLLAAVITKAADDGRYYKEVREDAASVKMPNIVYEDFYSNTHPVIINFAYEKLMDMERVREIPKGKNGGKEQKMHGRKRTEPER